MSTYFDHIEAIKYQGKNSSNPLSYRYYNPEQVVLGKTMAEQLRLAVCAWHNFCWQGDDNFGAPAFQRPWLQSKDPMQRAHNKVDALFELVSKLNVPFFTFHDRDLSPEADTLTKTHDNFQQIADYIAEKMQATGIKLLWGTANLFSHPRYLAGAATNPDPDVFCHAVSQVKKAIEVTHQLKGDNYVLWGGREGYDSLLNTNLKQESDQLARFLHMLVDYKHKIGFKGALLIEPKPCEPTKHQYDFDSATVYAFLQRYGLEKEFAVNIEANHAQLAGHSFEHEIAYAFANDIFGSIDANRGDPQLGWDTDQFPLDLSTLAQVMYLILSNGGFTTGGFNFDAKLRRQSIDLDDLFLGHISGIDTLARSLLIAEKMISQDDLKQNLSKRYQKWHTDSGQKILRGKTDFKAIAADAESQSLQPQPLSGKQEYWENWLNNIIE